MFFIEISMLVCSRG